MRLYIICPLMLVLIGCAATEPQASIKLKNPDFNGIMLAQIDGRTFEGSTEMLLRSNVKGIWIDTKIVDAGEVTFEQGGGFKLSLASCSEKHAYKKEPIPLTLNTIHPKGREKCLSLSVQANKVYPQAIEYSHGRIPPPVAIAYVTVCPPFDQ